MSEPWSIAAGNGVSASEQKGVGHADPPVTQLDARVLVVDDIASIRKLMICQIHTKMGSACKVGGQRLGRFDVEEAENGVRAVEAVKAARAKNRPFNVICMDTEMPVMDGYEATRLIRQLESESASVQPEGDPWPHRVLILGVTGNALEQDQVQFSAQGLDGVLTKPVDVAELVQAILEYVVPPI
jgi:CheY-like chemotaxis protein